MNSTPKELREWIDLGKRAFKRLPTTQKAAIVQKRRKIIRRRHSINGYVIEYDQVVEY
jgi:hypothetical protein